jgi:hypothetical protein
MGEKENPRGIAARDFACAPVNALRERVFDNCKAGALLLTRRSLETTPSGAGVYARACVM